MSEPVHADAHDLATFGYKQELSRSLGSFSSFAAGFSYISILTGMFQTAALGLLLRRPRLHLGLAGRLPRPDDRRAAVRRALGALSAGRVGVPVVEEAGGQAVGLEHRLDLPLRADRDDAGGRAGLAGDPAADLEQVPDRGLHGRRGRRPRKNCGFQDPAFAKNAFILGAVMIVLTTTVNLLGVRSSRRINNIGVIAELVGAAGLIILLAINIKHGPSVLFKTDGTGAGHDWGYSGALLLGAIMPLYVMYGFDTAGSLAEETEDPRRTAPKAVLACAPDGRRHGLPPDRLRHDGRRQGRDGRRAHLDHEGRARQHLGQRLAVGRRRSPSSSAASPSRP